MNKALQKIDHIVVLMMENRSFDHMLGWLYGRQNAPPFDQAPRGQSFEGVAGKRLANPIPAEVREMAETEICVGYGANPLHPNPDPGEEYFHVNTQLFNSVIPARNNKPPFNHKPYNLPSPEPAVPPMSGFVTDYVHTAAAHLGRTPTYDEYKIIMDCFTPEQLPVLSGLARHYAVCDHYHCSVPSQTFCNRSFIHSATSNGFVVNAPYVNWLLTDAPTIFNRIEENERPELTWKVYFDKADGFSFTWLIQPAVWKYRHSHFFEMERFYEDAAAGTLPSYSFIEPRLFLEHNDQHPPVGDIVATSSVLAGEQLIYDVYQALRQGKGWERTMLIITYDEHGGCYDHVPPPAAVPPEPQRPSGQYGFQFDRLGVRVPAVVVSPYTEAGTVLNSTYDHSSVVKTITERWGLDALTERDRAAAGLSAALNRTEPRDDWVELVPRPYEPVPEPENQPLSNLQRAILMAVAGMRHLDQFEEKHRLLEKLREGGELSAEIFEIVFELKTVGDAAAFIKHHLLSDKNNQE